MRLALVLALVSSLQIFQQSSVDPNQYDTIWQASLVTAAFPIGKFIATCFLSFNNVNLHSELDRCARLLIVGAVISAIPIISSPGIFYLILRPDEYPLDECTETVSIDGDAPEPIKSSHPVLFVFVLMVINVSIGVPLMQTFSTLIFSYYGMPKNLASIFSVLYPILQLIPVMISTRINVSRKRLVLGGYLVAIEAQFFLLLTSSYPYIPEKHQMIAMTVLLLILSISFVIPCNTALCILFEQFDGSNVKTASKSRCVMWFLASISTLTFSKVLVTYGFAVAFFPYFLGSVVSYAVMLFIFPSKHSFVIKL
ncbi:hypothetical protein B9Z55_019433 [Caenorhabditis nigoni]|nr:hypothetical protein B9Z55_019433 [Caenorhabditis nigoni]